MLKQPRLTEQVANALSKALKVLNATKLIKRYFNRTELLQLITSNVYSILYYNSEIWHLPSLKHLLTNRFSTLNGKIPLEWLNNSLNSFQIKC